MGWRQPLPKKEKVEVDDAADGATRSPLHVALSVALAPSTSSTKSLNPSSGRKRVRSENYGIIPWFHHGSQWYFLTQVCYSTMSYDFKVDPMRGKQVAHETPWETAVREVKEESGPHPTTDSFVSACYVTT